MQWRYPAAIFEEYDDETMETHRSVGRAQRISQSPTSFRHLPEGTLLKWRHVHKVYARNQHNEQQVLSKVYVIALECTGSGLNPTE